MHLSKRVTAVNAEAPVEPPLELERHAVIVRPAGVGLDEHVADFRESPAADKRRLARREHARLHRVQVASVTDHLPRAEKEVTGGNGDAAADLVRYLNAGLVTVRRLHSAIERVRERDAAGGWHLTGRQERSGGNWRQGAAHRALLKWRIDRSDRRKQHPRVRQRTRARIVRGMKQLSDAACETIVEDAVAASNDAGVAVRERAADARLEVVEIALRDVAAWIHLEVVAQPIGERGPASGLPLILHVEAVRTVIHRPSRRVAPSR